MSDQTCPLCDQPMLAPGQQRQHEDDYRHASGCPANRTCTDALLGFLFDGAAYVGIHKNAKGRITLVVNHGDGSMRTSCSKKGLGYTDKLIECRNRLSETPNNDTGKAGQ